MLYVCSRLGLSEYTKLSLKRELLEKVEQYINQYPERGYRSLAQFVEDAIREKADEMRIYELTPRFRHFNLDEKGVKIQDNEKNQIVDINFSPKGIQCEYCHSNTCRHVEFALSISTIRGIIKKKKQEGWKLPEV